MVTVEFLLKSLSIVTIVSNPFMLAVYYIIVIIQFQACSRYRKVAPKMSYDSLDTLLKRIDEIDPEFRELLETLVLARWNRFLRTHNFEDYKQPHISFSYPLLRPDDMKVFTNWDGRCFDWPQDIADFVERLVGDSIRKHGLNLAWLEIEEAGDVVRSLQIFDANKKAPTYLRKPYII